MRSRLESDWAARPLELVQEHGRAMLVLQDPGGEPLESLIGAPMDIERFLRRAIALPQQVRDEIRLGTQ